MGLRLGFYHKQIQIIRVTVSLMQNKFFGLQQKLQVFTQGDNIVYKELSAEVAVK